MNDHHTKKHESLQDCKSGVGVGYQIDQDEEATIYEQTGTLEAIKSKAIHLSIRADERILGVHYDIFEQEESATIIPSRLLQIVDTKLISKH